MTFWSSTNSNVKGVHHKLREEQVYCQQKAHSGEISCPSLVTVDPIRWAVKVTFLHYHNINIYCINV